MKNIDDVKFRAWDTIQEKMCSVNDIVGVLFMLGTNAHKIKERYAVFVEWCNLNDCAKCSFTCVNGCSLIKLKRVYLK